jgi:hypothetical protein
MTKRVITEDTRTPRRHIDKHEAIRHLIHAGVRMIMNEEDPFAIHVIVHSADKMILDVAKKRGVLLNADWKVYIKDEYHKEFFAKHRESYNYLKHADEDFNDELPVHDIMMLNVMTLFIAIANYTELFRECTSHMILYQAFIMSLSPAIIKKDGPMADELLRNAELVQASTPRAFFEWFKENLGSLPKFSGEVAEDLRDIMHFYHLSFAELREGKTESPRIFKLPNVDMAV